MKKSQLKQIIHEVVTENFSPSPLYVKLYEGITNLLYDKTGKLIASTDDIREILSDIDSGDDKKYYGYEREKR